MKGLKCQSQCLFAHMLQFGRAIPTKLTDEKKYMMKHCSKSSVSYSFALVVAPEKRFIEFLPYVVRSHAIYSNVFRFFLFTHLQMKILYVKRNPLKLFVKMMREKCLIRFEVQHTSLSWKNDVASFRKTAKERKNVFSEI